MKAPATKLAIKFPNEGVIFYFPLFKIIKLKIVNVDYTKYCSQLLVKNIINIVN